ncbi:MAG: TIGR03936 family radical SAM-associated protein [Candidatus Margulisbacteria bacterium]|jgi:radical SAM-linked protein|nr:TIGR03936 family radical SAM-associated protein [Candidatus Margulisiibacteriota bacterium]
MQKIKIVYKKGEEVKYIGHRDLMRAFQRAVRRADLPINYSQGFNPHMKISWGNALKVGATSDHEEAILEFAQWVKPDEVKARLNGTLPGGLAILDAFLV